MKQQKSRVIAEFGDFQTPFRLAVDAMRALKKLKVSADSILEPTCGKGAFVCAAAQAYPSASNIIGADINDAHLEEARKSSASDRRISLQQGDFFAIDWEKVLGSEKKSWLIVGNPPWVTSAHLGAIEGHNLPAKTNFQGRAGIDAITGKSNFDISEWMLLRYLDLLRVRGGAIAVLCKTAVARKIMLNAWRNAFPVAKAHIFLIDALSEFNAAVDACFFVVEVGCSDLPWNCEVFDAFSDERPSRTISYRSGYLISDTGAFERLKGLLGKDRAYTWRSGIKHDCSKVMELKYRGAEYENGLGEPVSIEDEFLYPLLKSSDVGNGRSDCRTIMIVPQRHIGEDTKHICQAAPLTWSYLQQHRQRFAARGSSIYKNKPEFSIFGVGAYSFAPWKVAISGFYKSLRFLSVGPVHGRPVVFDDTVYFLPCNSQCEADLLVELLSSKPATEFLSSMISWDEKRPITVDLLRRLNIRALAAMLGREEEYIRHSQLDSGPLFSAKSAA